MRRNSIISHGTALNSFFEKEKKHLLHFYPGLTLNRLRQDFKLMAVIHGIDNGTNEDEIFERPYLSSTTNPLSVFFDKLLMGIPLEYITGYRFFYKTLFRVSPDVLIPRSETEILVEKALYEIKNFNKNGAKIKVLDIGTGSGAIALSILIDGQVPIEMTATDISKKALEIAKVNFSSLKYKISKNHSLKFFEGDRFLALKNNDQLEKFDLILSNPPYIKKNADLPTVHQQVLNFEPHLALFLNDEEYETWFTVFFKDLSDYLMDGGVAFIEGHEDHLMDLLKLVKIMQFSEVKIIRDYTDRARFLKIIK